MPYQRTSTYSLNEENQSIRTFVNSSTLHYQIWRQIFRMFSKIMGTWNTGCPGTSYSPETIEDRKEFHEEKLNNFK